MMNPDISVKDIKDIFQAASIEELPDLIEGYAEDPRKGVISVVESARKRFISHEKELLRIYEMQSYEREYEDYYPVCGIDEAGRGPLAGPVVAGAVILPRDCDIMYINDSKKLSHDKREELYQIISEKAVAVGIGIVSHERIDEINILNATYEAMRAAISDMGTVPGVLLNDAVTIPGVLIRQVPIIKGDAKSLSIAAASIMAKVTRDRIMTEYEEVYPEYGFARHKGYGSKDHIEALQKHGPCPIHRRSFIKNIC